VAELREVKRERGGLPAGRIAEELHVVPATLSFHLTQLRHAGLIEFERDGRSLIYSAKYDAMDALLAYLTENCCQGDTTDGADTSADCCASPTAPSFHALNSSHT
jgi:DNA-binding transcriptional ArsR family regulator